VAVSIRQLAAATGLSVATVSHALRQSGRMAARTRRKVLRAAERLGYRANRPLAKALALARKPPEYRETLAVITEYARDEEPEWQREMTRLVEQYATRLGFKVEVHALTTGRRVAHERLGRVLFQRGVRGLIVLPRLRRRVARLLLDWDKFAAVELGRSLSLPTGLHKVDRPVYYEMLEVLHHLKRAGYQRVGLAVHPAESAYRKQCYTAAWLAAHAGLGERRRRPQVGLEGVLWRWQRGEFGRWMREYRPDVLLVQELRELLQWLTEEGWRVPEDVSVFAMSRRDPWFDGFNKDARGLAEACVDMVAQLLERNELGLPARPRVWMVQDELMAGHSLRLPLKRGGVGTQSSKP
jgi:LacI family transcriptional regulator